jgi:hypothetical protein
VTEFDELRAAVERCVDLDTARADRAALQTQWDKVRRVPAVWRLVGETPSDEGLEHLAEIIIREHPDLVAVYADSAALFELRKVKQHLEHRAWLDLAIAVLEVPR